MFQESKDSSEIYIDVAAGFSLREYCANYTNLMFVHKILFCHWPA